MNKKQKVILLLGIMLILCAFFVGLAAILLINNSVKPDLAIIGGADEPTYLLLWNEFRMPAIAVVLEFLAGIVCIIAAVRKKGKKNKDAKDKDKTR